MARGVIPAINGIIIQRRICRDGIVASIPHIWDCGRVGGGGWDMRHVEAEAESAKTSAHRGIHQSALSPDVSEAVLCLLSANAVLFSRLGRKSLQQSNSRPLFPVPRSPERQFTPRHLSLNSDLLFKDQHGNVRLISPFCLKRFGWFGATKLLMMTPVLQDMCKGRNAECWLLCLCGREPAPSRCPTEYLGS